MKDGSPVDGLSLPFNYNNRFPSTTTEAMTTTDILIQMMCAMTKHRREAILRRK